MNVIAYFIPFVTSDAVTEVENPDRGGILFRAVATVEPGLPMGIGSVLWERTKL